MEFCSNTILYNTIQYNKELREKIPGCFRDKEGELPGKLLSGNRNNTLILEENSGLV
jgi:hypothetical protein